MLLITPASNNEIARAYHASLTMLAQLALAVMLGFLSAVLFAGVYSDRHGKLPTIFAGCLSMTFGLLLFGSTGSFTILVVAAFMMGMGGGLSESTCMALMSDLYSNERRTAMANLSQASFSAGAVTSPLVIGWLLREGIDFRIGYFASAAVCAASGAITFAAMMMRREKPLGKHGGAVRSRQLIRDPLVLTLALGIMLYVGAEIGQSSWLAVYFERYLKSARSLAAASISFMWLGVGVGRISAAWASKHVSEPNIIRLSLAGAAACQAALLLLSTPIPGVVAVLGLGFFLGPTFPTIVSCAGGAYPERSGTVTAIVVAAGATGAAIFPPGIGRAADAVGLRPALWTCFAILAIDFLIFTALRLRKPRRTEMQG